MEPKRSLAHPYGDCPCCHRALDAPLAPTVSDEEGVARLGDVSHEVWRALLRMGRFGAIRHSTKTVVVPRAAFERELAGIPPGAATVPFLIAASPPAVTVEVVYRDPARGWGEAAP